MTFDLKIWWDEELILSNIPTKCDKDTQKGLHFKGKAIWDFSHDPCDLDLWPADLKIWWDVENIAGNMLTKLENDITTGAHSRDKVTFLWF